jgi:hypothetical protein
MHEVPATVNVYRAECSLSDAGSHFFPNQNNLCSRILSNNCTTTQEYIDTKVGISNEYFVGKLKDLIRNVLSKNICTFSCKLLYTQNFEHEI